LVPDHELALSTIINKSRTLQTPVDYDQAIKYLQRENMDLNCAGKGWSLVTFEEHAIGWVKLLPNRINNYFPKELRILSQLPLNTERVKL